MLPLLSTRGGLSSGSFGPDSLFFLGVMFLTYYTCIEYSEVDELCSYYDYDRKQGVR